MSYTGIVAVVLVASISPACAKRFTSDLDADDAAKYAELRAAVFKKGAGRCQTPGRYASNISTMSWLGNDEFWKFAMKSCQGSVIEKAVKPDLSFSFGSSVTTGASFIPLVGEYVSGGMEVMEDVINGRPSVAVGRTVDTAASISLGIATAGISSIVQLVTAVWGKAMRFFERKEEACYKCITSMMLQYPASQYALRSSGELMHNRGPGGGFDLCGTNGRIYEEEPALLDIGFDWMQSVGQVTDKFARVITGPATWLGLRFGSRHTDKDLDNKAAEVIAGAIQGGLYTVDELRDSKHGLQLSEGGHRESARQVLRACFYSDEEMTDLRAWWHTVFSTGVVPGIQTYTTSLSWNELLAKPDFWERKLNIEICRAVDFGKLHIASGN